MNRSTPGLPVHHQLSEFTEIHVHRVSDAIQPSHLLSSPSPPAPNPSQHHSLSNESTLRMRWPKYRSSALASFLPKKSQGWSPSEWTGWISLQSKGLSRVFSNTTVQKHQFFGAQVTKSCPALCDPMDCSMPGFPVHYPTPGACSNSCPSSWWCHPTSSFSAIPFSSCLQSFPASRSFPMSQLFESGGQSIGASVSSSVLPMNIQDWFPLGLTGLISLQSKGFSRVFSNTMVLLSLLSPFCFTRF